MTTERWDRLAALAAAATPGAPRQYGAESDALYALRVACDPATIRDLVAAARERDELRGALTVIRSVCDEPIEYLGGSHRIRMVIVPAIIANALGEEDMSEGLRRELFDKFAYLAALHRKEGAS